MNSRKKGRSFEHIGLILDKTIKSLRPEATNILSEIKGRWEETVGKAVAEETRPFYLKGKVLIVHVAHSILLHHLMFMKPDMINKINQAAGKKIITDIDLKVGQV